MSAADALRVSAIKRSGHACPGKLKCPPLPSGCEISGWEMSADWIPDVKCPEKVESQPDRIPPRVEWAMSCVAIRSNSIRIPQEDLRHAPLSGLPQEETHGTGEHHTRTIAYPIRICCPDHWLMWASLATAHVPPPSCPDALSGHLLFLAFRICLWQRTSKIRFFMFLSFPLLCHGF